MTFKKYDIVFVDLEPRRGSEQGGKRPALVVQNNEVNKYSRTLVLCPFSAVIKEYFFTLIVDASQHNGLSKKSRLDLLQIRVVDTSRIVKKIGVLEVRYRNEFRQRMIDSFDLDDLFE